MELKHPLTETHLAEIQRGLEGVNVALYQIELAGRAGIDVSAAKVKAEELRSSLLKIKQVYFPGR